MVLSGGLTCADDIVVDNVWVAGFNKCGRVGGVSGSGRGEWIV